jgi:hypothetical protein
MVHELELFTKIVAVIVTAFEWAGNGYRWSDCGI